MPVAKKQKNKLSSVYPKSGNVVYLVLYKDGHGTWEAFNKSFTTAYYAEGFKNEMKNEVLGGLSGMRVVKATINFRAVAN